MSIETFQGPPGHTVRTFLIFFALSVLLHILALGLASFAPREADRARDARLPIPVEILDLPQPREERKSIPVAEAPPAEPDNISPVKKPPSVFADKDQSVKKETAPPSAPPVPSAPMTTQRAAPAMPQNDASSEAARTAPLPGAGKEGAESPGAGAGTSKEEPSPVDEPVRTGPEGPASLGTRSGPRILQEEQRRPSLFPTDERISELTKNYEADSHEKETGKTLQLNTAELKYQRYLMDMKRKIEFYWDYPALAARNGWQGALWINFRINRDGTVSELRLEKSSGYPMLDDAAITAIRLAAPFPPFPANFTVEDISIKGQFQYNIVAPRGG